MRNPIERVLLVSAVIACAAVLAWTPPAAAGNPQFRLYGNNVDGWGFTDTQLSNPGPEITVDLGDNVTLVLSSTDGNQYRWFLDYDNDSIRDANEPQSGNFRTTPITWNFTANTPGTFTYRSRSDPDVMYGTFIVRNQTGLFGLPPLSLSTLVLIVGLVVAFVAVLAVGAIVARRKQEKRT